MTSKLIDLTGNKYGRLTVVGFSHFEWYGKAKHKTAFWECICECGNKKIANAGLLRNGSTRSCGCYRRESAAERHFKGGHNHKLYDVLRMMKKRCYDNTCEYYQNYGGRGITICDEWLKPNGHWAFQKWALENGYEDGLTIDRIDNNKGYSPENCRWVTRKFQSNNKRNNVWITMNGETKTLAEWCEYYNMPYARVEARYTKMGWSIEDALFTPRYKKPKGA